MEKIFTRENKNLSHIVISRAEENISTELEGETIILDIVSGVYSGLNPIGTTIWDMLEKAVTFADICNNILGEYQVDEECCTNDLMEFLNILLEHGLVMVQDEKDK